MSLIRNAGFFLVGTAAGALAMYTMATSTATQEKVIDSPTSLLSLAASDPKLARNQGVAESDALSPLKENVIDATESTPQASSPTKLTRDWGQILSDNITASDILILYDHAVELSEYIQGDSTRLDQVSDILLGSDNAELRGAMIEMSHLLPTSNKEVLVQRLLGSHRSSDRTDAISLLESISDEPKYLANTLERLLYSESDNDVINEAILAVENVSYENEITELIPALEHHLRSSRNLQTQTTALNALVNVGVVNDLTTKTIIGLMNSNEPKRLKIGINGLALILNKMDKKTVGSLNTELVPSLESIANQRGADPSIRITALSILMNHFSEEN